MYASAGGNPYWAFVAQTFTLLKVLGLLFSTFLTTLPFSLISLKCCRNKHQLICFEQRLYNMLQYLVIVLILQYFKSIPCFLIDIDISPVISIVANMSCNLDKPSFICEYHRDSASNGTTIICSCCKAEKFCPLPALQVCSIKRVDVQFKVHAVGWTQGGHRLQKIVLEHRRSN